MPKIGMEPIRRKALTDAAIEAIGARGSMDVTMSDIAGRAGVSPALAHHYFGSKEQLITASVRALLQRPEKRHGRSPEAGPQPPRAGFRDHRRQLLRQAVLRGSGRGLARILCRSRSGRRRSVGCSRSMRGGCIPT
jgi:AcrR family transcriptional regulator